MKVEPRCYHRHIRVQQIKADALAKETTTAVRSYLQGIRKFVQIFSYVPAGAIKDLEGFARISKELTDEIDVELEQMRKQFIKSAIDHSYADREHLALCIRCILDGIETNYRSWKEWQSKAMLMLEKNIPEKVYRMAKYRDMVREEEAHSSEMRPRKKGVINNPKVINNRSEKVERKGK